MLSTFQVKSYDELLIGIALHKPVLNSVPWYDSHPASGHRTADAGDVIIVDVDKF
jgi:hypothetical protein